MTTENAPSGGGSGDQRAQALEAQLASLEAAMSSVKWTRRIIIILFLGFIVLVGFMIKGMADELASQQYREELLAEAQKTLQDESDTYMRHAKLLSDNVTPVVTKAFYAQAKKDAPLYTGAFDREKQKLADNLRVRIEEMVNQFYKEAIDKYEAEIVTYFPKAKDDKVRRQLKENLRLSLNKLVNRFYAEELKRELNELYAAWETFPPADAAVEGEKPLEDQLIGYLFELLSIKMSGNDTDILDVGTEAASAAGTEGIETTEGTETTEGETSETDKPTGTETPSNN